MQFYIFSVFHAAAYFDLEPLCFSHFFLRITYLFVLYTLFKVIVFEIGSGIFTEVTCANFAQLFCMILARILRRNLLLAFYLRSSWSKVELFSDKNIPGKNPSNERNFIVCEESSSRLLLHVVWIE